jgi:hypothetical protein
MNTQAMAFGRRRGHPPILDREGHRDRNLRPGMGFPRLLEGTYPEAT